MNANTKYTDLKGRVSADISDFIGNDNNLQDILEDYNLEKEKYKVIGININGVSEIEISLICIDKSKSTKENDYLVELKIERGAITILEDYFKKLRIILFEDSKYLESEIICTESINITNN
ncbi:MAG: hypothetical protein HXX09_13810 [Bacteroidetes bacterium]|nr:hypothetical protein [Bacteroidota bacterium]